MRYYWYIFIYSDGLFHVYILINPCNAYNINQDSGAWVLILEGFWVLKLVFEWCRIHIKTVLAQHYSLVVFYPILLWFTYAWFIQATPVQVGPGPPKSAQVNPNLQVLPGSPRFLVISCDFVGFRDFLGEPGCYFLRSYGWDFLGEPGSYFLRFCGFPGFPGRTWVLFSAFLWVSGISCGVSGISWVETVGDGPGRAARVTSGKSGWRVARYFDPQFLNFCRRRCRVCHALKFSYQHYRGIAIYIYIYTCWFGYSEPLKSTNLTELCQISLGRRRIRKSNKLTKSKVNPNGTPMYDKLCFGKFCCVKDEETPCGRNSQNIFKVVLNTTKNTHVILGRQWFSTCRLQVITRKAAFTCWIL